MAIVILIYVSMVLFYLVVVVPSVWLVRRLVKSVWRSERKPQEPAEIAEETWPPPPQAPIR